MWAVLVDLEQRGQIGTYFKDRTEGRRTTNNYRLIVRVMRKHEAGQRGLESD